MKILLSLCLAVFLGAFGGIVFACAGALVILLFTFKSIGELWRDDVLNDKNDPYSIGGYDANPNNN